MGTFVRARFLLRGFPCAAEWGRDPDDDSCCGAGTGEEWDG
jgi:hypothetical protein